MVGAAMLAVDPPNATLLCAPRRLRFFTPKKKAESSDLSQYVVQSERSAPFSKTVDTPHSDRSSSTNLAFRRFDLPTHACPASDRSSNCSSSVDDKDSSWRARLADIKLQYSIPLPLPRSPVSLPVPHQPSPTLEAPEVDDSAVDEEVIVAAIDKVLTHMAARKESSSNDLQKADDDERLQRRSSFDAHREPIMSISKYFSRLRRYFDCSVDTYVLALVYIDRVVRDCPEFVVDHMSCHRLFLVSALVAVKYHEDDYETNGYYAKVGGLSLPEMNMMECDFLRMLKWRLFVSVNEFRFYRAMVLMARHGATAEP